MLQMIRLVAANNERTVVPLRLPESKASDADGDAP
jgi:hypothetical protein